MAEKNILDKLIKLHKEHPELPVVTMVDTEVVPSDDFSYWISRIRAVNVKKYMVVDGEVLFYEDMDYDNAWMMYDYSYIRSKIDQYMSEEEVVNVLVELYEKASWKEAIIIWVGVDDGTDE